MGVGRRTIVEIVANTLDAQDYSFEKTASIDKESIVFKGRHIDEVAHRYMREGFGSKM